MKKLCVYFFSGTGMTKHVIEKMIRVFEQYGISIDCFKIEEPHIHSSFLSEYDLLGIAYPVHSFNAPQIVVDFIKQLPESNGMNTFILYTAGEEHRINNASSDLLMKKLCKRGYKVFYNNQIGMPSNFVVKYEDEKVKRILKNANEVIPFIANNIMELKPYFVGKNIGSKIISLIGRAEWFGAKIIGKFYYVKSSCVRCGKCMEDCPNQNIIAKKESIGFKWRCGMCMRCIYQCPQNAISVHQPFKFICFDEWYDSKMLEL